MADSVFSIVMDANVLLAAGIAFAAGLVGFASPCVIPLVPGYLSFMTGLSGEDLVHGGVRARSRVLIGSILFVVGFAVPFVMLGFAAGLVNFLFRSTGQDRDGLDRGPAGRADDRRAPDPGDPRQ